MSELSIYSALRNGGLSPAGACAMMGNMWAESGLRSNNVQDNCTLGDHDYTYAVDIGTISRYQFKLDRYGYGLCQWTFFSRKEELYDLARAKNVSISDEAMQVEFCLTELKRDYPALYEFLCTTTDISKAAEDICDKFEQPAVNNFAVRINAAVGYYNQFGVMDTVTEEEYEAPQVDIIHNSTQKTFVYLELGDGCRARGYKPSYAVRAWQDMLLYWGFDVGDCGADGEFGSDTQKATKEWQKYVNDNGFDVEVNGVVDEDDWKAIIEVVT